MTKGASFSRMLFRRGKEIEQVLRNSLVYALSAKNLHGFIAGFSFLCREREGEIRCRITLRKPERHLSEIKELTIDHDVVFAVTNPEGWASLIARRVEMYSANRKS